MQAIERIIIVHFLTAARAAGFVPDRVSDGEQMHICMTDDEVLTVVDAVDESHVYFSRAGTTGKRESVFIVIGNGMDCIADMSCGRDDWDTLCTAEETWVNAQAPEDMLGEALTDALAQVAQWRESCVSAVNLVNVQKVELTKTNARFKAVYQALRDLRHVAVWDADEEGAEEEFDAITTRVDNLLRGKV